MTCCSREEASYRTRTACNYRKWESENYSHPERLPRISPLTSGNGLAPTGNIKIFTMYETLLTALAENIFTITINRPEKLNALNQTVIRELGQAVQEVYDNPQIRAALITGSGQKAFAAGADIRGFSGLDASQGLAL